MLSVCKLHGVSFGILVMLRLFFLDACVCACLFALVLMIGFVLRCFFFIFFLVTPEEEKERRNVSITASAAAWLGDENH